MRKIYYLIIVLLVYSCNSHNKHVIEYYPNGNIKCEYDTIGNGVKNGVLKYYYETGKIKERIKYYEEKKDGWDVNYYENGKIKDSSEYLLIYKENHQRLDILYDSINADKKMSYHNRMYRFDEKGNLINQISSFYTIKMNDTISLGDTLTFRFELTCPELKTAEKGRFIFELRDSKQGSCTHVKPPDARINISKYYPTTRGVGYIYGLMMEIDDPNKSYFIWYIKEKYFVK